MGLAEAVVAIIATCPAWIAGGLALGAASVGRAGEGVYEFGVASVAISAVAVVGVGAAYWLGDRRWARRPPAASLSL